MQTMQPQETNARSSFFPPSPCVLGAGQYVRVHETHAQVCTKGPKISDNTPNIQCIVAVVLGMDCERHAPIEK